MKSIVLDFSCPLDSQISYYKKCSIAPYFNKVLDYVSLFSNDDFEVEVKTSGSTGTPKTMVFDKHQVMVSAALSVAYFELHQNSNIFLSLSIDTVGAKMLVARALVAQAKIHIFIPTTNIFKELNSEELPDIDFISVTAHQLTTILNESPRSFLKIKKCLIGGENVSEHLKKMISKFPTCQFYESFGMTETLSHIAIKNLSKNESYFKVLPTFKISVDVDHSLVIFHQDITKFPLKTNDIVELISDSSFIWKGRKDNIINSGGIKILAEEIEAVLKTFVVGDLAISYLPDDVLGQKIVLVIENNNKITLDTIKNEFINRNISKYWLPKEIITINEIPKTSNGKIKRDSLRDYIQKK